MSRTSTGKSSLSSPVPPAKEASKHGLPIIFTHLGRKGYTIVLWAPTAAGRKKWLEKIEERQQQLRSASLIFEPVVVSEGYFVGPNKITCAAPFGESLASCLCLPLSPTLGTDARHGVDSGNHMVYGTDAGVYFSDLRQKKPPVKMISVASVTQVDVLEDHGILIVLAGLFIPRPCPERISRFSS
jgi:hypothetical protein